MNYEMGGTILCKTVKENDIGVAIKPNMKVSEQCRIAAYKSNHSIVMIRVLLRKGIDCASVSINQLTSLRILSRHGTLSIGRT